MGIFEENIPDEIETWYIYDVRDRAKNGIAKYYTKMDFWETLQ